MKAMVVVGALVTGASIYALLPARPAVACGGAMLDEATYVEQAIAKRALLQDAQQLVEIRSFEAAAATLQRVTPVPEGSEERGRRIFAKLIVRSDGAYDRFARHRPKERREHLRRATAVLASLPRDDPRTLTDLAEALGKDPDRAAVARDLLEDLARRDLITSAEGWATLARLRTSPQARDEATTRCQRMAIDPAESCGPATGES
jgi:hypothetical protein